MENLKDRLLSEKNIFLAIHLSNSWMQNRELLDEDDLKHFWALKDVFDQDYIRKIMEDVKCVLEKILDDRDAFFHATVFFKPKEDEVFRPLHSASLIEQIAMVAMLQVLIYEISAEDKLIPSELSRMLPSHFYGNLVSYDAKSLFKPWQEQYHEYTSKANDHLINFSRSAAYHYEINLDLRNFFPSIHPQVLFQFIRTMFPLKWNTNDISTAETILRKLLLFELDKLDENEWKWYLNGEKRALPKGRLFAKGQPQGLPHTYFIANLFMLLIEGEYKKVFPGEMLFYVDDSVIFTNGTQGHQLTENNFKKCIENINLSIQSEENRLRNENLKEDFLPTDYPYQPEDFGVVVHDPDKKSTFACIEDAYKNSGELYLRSLSRETSKTSFDFSTMFVDDDVAMLLSRTQAISKIIEEELKAIQGYDIGKKIQRKKLLRYKKFFSYRETILHYRSDGKLELLIEEIIQAVSMREKDDQLNLFWEKYNDDILAAVIPFLLKRCYDDKIPNEDLVKAVHTLCKKLYGDSDSHAYLKKVYAPYMDQTKMYDDVDPYSTLNRIMNGRYRGIREQFRKNKLERFRKLLSDNANMLDKNYDISIFQEFNLKNLQDWSVYVRSSSSELERKILNAAFSCLFGYDVSDRFVFTKKNREAILYSEIRILASLKNKAFSYSQFIGDYSQFTADIYQSTADYYLLQVLEVFRTFVRETAQIDQLICIHKYCCDTWKNGSKHLHFYTLHNQEHAVTLINLAVRWLHAIPLFNLKHSDYFILFAACYLHDISMVSLPDYDKFYMEPDQRSNHIFTEVEGVFQKEDDVQSQRALLRAYQDIEGYFEQDIRDHHARNSAREIRSFKELDFIDPSIREFIARISEAHGDSTLDVYCAKSRGATELVNEKQLKILLRLSDLLDMSRYRISDIILKHNISKLSDTSRFHWISHLITDSCNISTEYRKTENPGSDSSKTHPLKNGCITEKLVLTVNILMSQTTPIINQKACKFIKGSELTEDEDGHAAITISCEGDAQCKNEQCNFLCKWFTLKNEYLLQELGQLKQYLNDIPELFFRPEVEIRVRVVADRDIPNDIFDYLRKYVSTH